MVLVKALQFKQFKVINWFFIFLWHEGWGRDGTDGSKTKLWKHFDKQKESAGIAAAKSFIQPQKLPPTKAANEYHWNNILWNVIYLSIFNAQEVGLMMKKYNDKQWYYHRFRAYLQSMQSGFDRRWLGCDDVMCDVIECWWCNVWCDWQGWLRKAEKYILSRCVM